MGLETNTLYFGDCLDVMREDIPDATIDLIYLDPPFNSKRLYNAFLGGAQWVAFDDTWRWYEAIDDFHEVASEPALAGTMEGLRSMLGEGAQLAYLSYMANRLRECRRVLKNTGSIYLHCDTTMSHYLKVLMDGLFGTQGFRNEVIWRRTTSHSDAKGLGRVHDAILFYNNSSSDFTWNKIFQPLDPEYVKRYYRYEDANGRKFMSADLSGAGTGPARRFGNRGVIAPPNGRHWMYDDGGIAKLMEDDKVYWTRNGVPRLKVYLDENPGVPAQDVWTDILPLRSWHKERVGFPTQKPIALLERIIKASSNPGDTVLDPFCGCGTTVHAAQNLDRRWIGIDVCVNACKVIEQRLRQHFDSLWSSVEFIGMPKTRDDAKTLADMDKFRFERWAASLVDGMEFNKKQRADKGIDGYGRIAIRKGKFVDMVSQVKGGSTGPGDVQAFNGARQQAGADLGIFTCFQDRVTANMRNAAASTGRFMNVPTVQIYTVEDYFEGRHPQLPAAG